MTLSVAFLALFILVHSVSSRFYYFKVEYRKIILIFLWAILSYELSYLLLDWAGDETNLKMLSVLPLAIFPVLAWYGGIFSSEEKSMLMRIVHQRLMKMRGAGRAQEVES